MLWRPDREHTFFRPRLFLVPPCTPERRIEAVRVQCLSERLGFHDVGVQRRTMLERIDAVPDTLLVCVHEQLHPVAFGSLVSKLNHLPELPRGIHVQQRKRRLRREECLQGKVQHHGAVLANGVEHHGPTAFRDDLAHDMNAFSFEALEMCELGQRRRRYFCE